MSRVHESGNGRYLIFGNRIYDKDIVYQYGDILI